jgi:hypothetical protein
MKAVLKPPLTLGFSLGFISALKPLPTLRLGLEFSFEIAKKMI